MSTENLPQCGSTSSALGADIEVHMDHAHGGLAFGKAPPPLERLLYYCEESNAHGYGTVSADLVRELVDAHRAAHSLPAASKAHEAQPDGLDAAARDEALKPDQQNPTSSAAQEQDTRDAAHWRLHCELYEQTTGVDTGAAIRFTKMKAAKGTAQ